MSQDPAPAPERRLLDETAAEAVRGVITRRPR
jgi:hypothetical protein